MIKTFVGDRRALGSFLLAGLLSGCGAQGEGNPSAGVPVEDVGVAPEFAAVGAFEGHYRAGQGLTFSEVPFSAALQGGLVTQGFVPPLSGRLSFATPSDGVGTGSCTPNQYCAQVQLTNLTGVTFDNVYIEVTAYRDVLPSGARVGWAGAAFDKSDVFRSIFVNPANVEAASYGTLTGSQSRTVEWKWDLDLGSPNSTTFDFGVAAYVSVRRTQTFSGVVANAQPAMNACAMAGATTLIAGGSDDAERIDVALPFPYTLFDITYDRAVVGSNGYALFYITNGAVPSAAGANVYVGPGSSAPAGLYPFWDDLLPDGGVCIATTGTKPYRTTTLTWRNARIATNQPTVPKVWSTDRVTFSITLDEGTDRTSFQWDLPEGSITAFTRGQSATIGERGIRAGAAYGRDLSFNAPGGAGFIPSVSNQYGTRFWRLARPFDP